MTEVETAAMIRVLEQELEHELGKGHDDPGGPSKPNPRRVQALRARLEGLTQKETT